jgi:hypothetical protein
VLKVCCSAFAKGVADAAGFHVKELKYETGFAVKELKFATTYRRFPASRSDGTGGAA